MASNIAKVAALLLVAVLLCYAFLSNQAPVSQKDVATPAPSVTPVTIATPDPAPRAELLATPTPHLLMGDNKKNYVAPHETRQSIAEEERNRAGSEGAPPEIGGVWGVSLEVHDAIKAVLRDPDSYKFEGVSGPWVTTYQGKRCWLEKVQFRARNGFGGYDTDTASVWVVVIGHTGSREQILGVQLGE
jgi:hypothetical protein